MQPLSYQIGRSTCTGTSIVNGIMYLRWKYLPKKKARIESYQYKLLYDVLNSMLYREGVSCYEHDKITENYNDVIDILGSLFSMHFRWAIGAEVSAEIRNLDFDRQVAVCDVGNGDHTILLNGKDKRGNWLYAFDPWWYGQGRKNNATVKFPSKIHANVQIRLDHLLDDAYEENAFATGTAYPMGEETDKHFLTVIECRTRAESKLN